MFYSVTGSGKHSLSYTTGAARLVEEEAFASVAAGPVAFFGSETAISAEPAGNKLVRAGGWAPLAAGDIVAVAELGGGNPSWFVALVVQVDGDDLRLAAAWRTLAAVTGSATVKVYRSRRQRMGSRLLTSTWELYRAGVASGEIYRGVSHKSLQYAFTHPGIATVTTASDGLRLAEDVNAPLANPSAASEAYPFYSSGIPFGDGLRPNSGLGFRYNGAEAQEVLIHAAQSSIERPRKLTGGAGKFGPQLINVDGKWTARFTWSTIAAASSADVEVPQWLADAKRSEFELDLSYGYADADGRARLFRHAKLQLTKGQRDGRESSGDQMAMFEAVASRGPGGLADALEIHDFAPAESVVP